MCFSDLARYVIGIAILVLSLRTPPLGLFQSPSQEREFGCKYVEILMEQVQSSHYFGANLAEDEVVWIHSR